MNLKSSVFISEEEYQVGSIESSKSKKLISEIEIEGSDDRIPIISLQE
jgi:hypothetical protein